MIHEIEFKGWPTGDPVKRKATRLVRAKHYEHGWEVHLSMGYLGEEPAKVAMKVSAADAKDLGEALIELSEMAQKAKSST